MVQNIFFRLFVRNLGFGRVGNLIPTFRAGRDLAVSQQHFASLQPNPLLRPEDTVANAIGNVNFARLSQPNKVSPIVVKLGEVAGHGLVTGRRLP